MQRLWIFLLALVSAMSVDADSSDDSMVTPLPADGWRLVTDAVMGGVSAGRLSRQTRAGRACICLAGEVRTENNGGFIQLALDVDDRVARRAAEYDGIRLQVVGNAEAYAMHLRTRDLGLPWQSYRAGLVASPAWQTVQLPFERFQPYRTDAPLRVDRLRRIGIVAIGRAFAADICVADLALYRDRD